MFPDICVILLTLHLCAYSVPLKNNSAFTSTYAKVAKWGFVTQPQKPSAGEGRSSGQSFFTQRSDAKITSGQIIKPKEIVYHYSMDTNSRVGEDKSEELPAQNKVVIQDRFNPPPYFDYGRPLQDPDHPDHHEHHESKPPAVIYGASADSLLKNVDAKPSMDSYDSSISSYSAMPSGKPKEVDKSPIDSYDSPISSYNPIPSGLPSKPSSALFTPNNRPFQDDKQNSNSLPGYVYDSPMSDFSMPDSPMPDSLPPDLPLKNSMAMSQPPSMSKFPGPLAPPSDEDDSKYQNSFMSQSSGGHHQGSSMEDQGPPITKTVEHPSGGGYYDDFDQHPQYHNHQHHNHEVADLSPPSAPSAPSAPSFPKTIPEYLDHDPAGNYHYSPYHFNDHHHLEHHVYHEVTTTTEAPEDERVNKGHYSYYYLGRKLWYIPLYFSVYFIIYITVLILKSIARHKVNFVHEYDKGKGRSFDMDDLTTNVTTSIDTFTRRYQRRYLAM